jgi:hypothetical protein
MTNQFHIHFYSSAMKWDIYLHILRFLHFTDNKNETDMTDENYEVTEDTKSVWISKQDIFKILQPFWTSGYSRSYCFVQRNRLFLTIHTQVTQRIWHQNLQPMWCESLHIWYDSYFFPWRSKKNSYRDSRFTLVTDILEAIVQVVGLE